jgi:hypothetical protein
MKVKMLKAVLLDLDIDVKSVSNDPGVFLSHKMLNSVGA